MQGLHHTAGWPDEAVSTSPESPYGECVKFAVAQQLAAQALGYSFIQQSALEQAVGDHGRPAICDGFFLVFKLLQSSQIRVVAVLTKQFVGIDQAAVTRVTRI